MGTWMIYGANGYTGQLTAELAVEHGHKPVLAGRRATAIVPLAERLGLEHRIFGLDDRRDAIAALHGIDAVLHCAGPFSATSQPMLSACLGAGAHYLDITGEIAVFERVFARGPEIAARGISAIPGVGFDVVPTDTMAALLAAELPNATHLELAFAGLGGGVSQGTAKSAVEGLPHGGAARIKGRIKKVPPGWKTKTVRLGEKDTFVVSIPWGDVSTAYQSTGIPNITTYAAFPRSAVPWMKRAALVSGLIARPSVQAFLKGQVEKRVKGPTAEQRATGRSLVWGRAEDEAGHWVEGNLEVAEGYKFTAQSSLAAVQRVLAGGVPVGALTPTKAFGSGFLASLEGVKIHPVRRG